MMEGAAATVDTSGSRGERVPLRWLLDRPDLGLVPHHLPDQAVGLAWAHAIELDDPVPWLPDPAGTGPGLLLTTGLRLPRTQQGQEAYVARLADAGVGALGVGTGLRLPAVPLAVVAACRAHGLPLLEVPLATPFLAVVRALSDRLAELRRQRLHESVTAQGRITRAALRRGVRGAAQELARALGASALVVTPEGVALARAGSPPGSPPVSPPGSPPLSVAEVLDAVGRHESPGSLSLADAGRVLEIQPLGAGPGQVAGWLAVARRHPLDPTDRLVLSHAVGVLTLERTRPATPRDSGLAAATLHHLVRGSGATPADLLTGAGLTPPLALVGVRGDEPSAVRRFVDELHRHDPVLAAPGTDDGRCWLLLTSVAAGRPLAAPPAGVAAVVAAPLAATQLPTTLPWLLDRLAATALGAAVSLTDDPAARVATDPSLLVAVGPWRAALEEYDAVHDAPLLPCVSAYLRHHGTWDPAAQELGLHRHTLRQRVRRASQVAGFDLDDPRHRALLTLALT